MSTTVLEALESAKINFETVGRMIPPYIVYKIGISQLGNAIKALENGIDPNATIQEGVFDEVNTGD